MKHSFYTRNWNFSSRTELKFSLWLTAVVSLANQIICKYSNELCDWLKLARFMRVQMHAHAISVRLENKVCFENYANAWGNYWNYWILYYETNKDSSTVLCSVVKHLGSGQSTQEVGRNTRLRLVFPPILLSCSSRFLRALQQNRAQSRLLYLLIWAQPKPQAT